MACTVLKFIMLYVFLYIVVCATLLEQLQEEEDTANTESSTDNQPDIEDSIGNVLFIALIRTSILYLYLVVILYLVILFGAQETVSGLLRNLGEFLLVITLIIFLLSEFYPPSRFLCLFLSRTVTILFFLSVFQIFLLLFLFTFRALGFFENLAHEMRAPGIHRIVGCGIYLPQIL